MTKDNAATIVIAYLDKVNTNNNLSQEAIVSLYAKLLKAEGEKAGS